MYLQLLNLLCVWPILQEAPPLKKACSSDFLFSILCVMKRDMAKPSRAFWRDTSNKPFHACLSSRGKIYEERERIFSSADGLYVLLCGCHLSPSDRISLLALAC